MEQNAAKNVADTKVEDDVLLDVEDLNIRFKTKRGYVNAVEHLNFQVKRGELLALVGESGCGKSVTSLAIMDLIGRPGEVWAKHIILNGKDLTKLSPNAKRKMRGTEMAMIFQDPLTSLNPLYTIGNQLSEQFLTHIPGCTKQMAKEMSIDIIHKTGIPRPEAVYKSYPHELSGGMRQRIMIAIALACNPKLLIADEPTTALDVTIQAQVLAMIQDLRERLGMSMLMITHDLGIVAEICDYVAVMYAGEIVEYGSVWDVYTNPKHPYTRGLFESIPKMDVDDDHLVPIPGLAPNSTALPAGCYFHPRCKYCQDKCCEQSPPMKGETHQYKCWLDFE